METLKKNYEFKNVLSKGKGYFGKYVKIYCKKNNKDINVIGIAIQKKTGKANKRNKIKRRIKESYRQAEKEIEKGMDIVFLWNSKENIEEGTFDNINRDIKKILKIIKF